MRVMPSPDRQPVGTNPGRVQEAAWDEGGTCCGARESNPADTTPLSGRDVRVAAEGQRNARLATRSSSARPRGPRPIFDKWRSGGLHRGQCGASSHNRIRAAHEQPLQPCCRPICSSGRRSDFGQRSRLDPPCQLGERGDLGTRRDACARRTFDPLRDAGACRDAGARCNSFAQGSVEEGQPIRDGQAIRHPVACPRAQRNTDRAGQPSDRHRPSRKAAGRLSPTTP